MYCIVYNVYLLKAVFLTTKWNIFFTVQLACFSYLNDQDQHLPAALNWHQFHFLTIAMERNMPRRRLGGCAGQLFCFFALLMFCWPCFALLLLFCQNLTKPCLQLVWAQNGLWLLRVQLRHVFKTCQITSLPRYLWICQALGCSPRYGPIAYRAVVAVAGCAPDPDLMAQVSYFLSCP